MGKKGRQFEYKEERDRDLIEVYRTIYANAPITAKLHQVLQKTVASPSKRFWVSPERAFKVIGDIRSGKNLDNMNTNKRLMFFEIEKRVSEVQKTEAHNNLGLYDIICIVIEQPAPCFYMTPESAKVIIHHIKKKWYKERTKLLRFLR